MSIRYDLPVYRNRAEILDALEKANVIVVESPTGSGKTTQLPLILNEAGYTAKGIIGVTQPRRIAALSVSEYISRQLESEDGFVSCKMRFYDTTKANTKIKIMTDGILLEEFKTNRQLSSYSVIMVDEAHERSLNIDFILGMLKQLINQRSDLKIIISSATINTKTFSDYFDGCPIVSIDSRPYPVDIFYNPPESGNMELIYKETGKIVNERCRKPSGDILIFMPGEFDINATIDTLRGLECRSKLEIYPLYGRLSKEEQERVFTPTSKGKTKVVVATNIAETSLTIDGVTCVIDSGFAKINFYNQKDFTSALVPMPISKSSAKQRSGRAGRTAPGVCYRLYSKEDYNLRQEYSSEEILRTDLSEVCLRMSDLGITDYEHFPFITSPRSSAFASAVETLRIMRAIDNRRNLTSIGQMMARFPLTPRHSRILVEAVRNYPDVISKVIVAVAFLSTKTPFLLPAEEEDAARARHRLFMDSEYGDFVSYLKILRIFDEIAVLKEREVWCRKNYLDFQSMREISNIRSQLESMVSDMGVPLSDKGPTRDYLICICSGLIQYVCRRTRGVMYKSLTADKIFIHPGSSWFREPPSYIVAGEIVQTTKMYARTVSPVKKEWLQYIDTDLPKVLADAVRTKKEKKKAAPDAVETSASPIEGYRLYGRIYPYIDGSGKGKKKQSVLIPLSDLEFLRKQAYSTRKNVPNFNCTITHGNFYIHRNDSFYNVLRLVGKTRPNDGIIDSIPKKVYRLNEDTEELIEKTEHLMQFAVVKEGRRDLGFVTLDSNRNNEFTFRVQSNCFDAIDNSIYSLSNLYDAVHNSNAKREISRIRNSLIALLDD